MSKVEINSKEYWENRFETDWIKYQGDEQTIFFANIAVQLMPSWLVEECRSEKYSFCDMGCALGEAVDVLSQYLGYNIEGADFSIEAIKSAMKNYPENKFTVMDVNNLPSNIKYDVVYSSNVLEHFENPWKILKNLVKVAQKYIILLVPFEEKMEINEHLYRFEINNILTKIDGFSLVYAKTIDGSKFEKTYYSDKQIMLIYSNQEKAKRIAVLGELVGNVESEDSVVFTIWSNRYELLHEQFNQCNEQLKKSKEELKKCNEQFNKCNEELKKAKKDCEKLELRYEKLEKEKEKEKEISLRREDELQIELRNSLTMAEDIKISNLKLIEELNKKHTNELEYTNKVYDEYKKENLRYIDYLNEEIRQLNSTILNMKASFSWRITSGFRGVSKLLGFANLHQKIRNVRMQLHEGNSMMSIFLYRIKNSRLFPILKKIVPYHLQHKLSRKYNSSMVVDLSSNSLTLKEVINRFINEITDNQQVILVFSGCKYIDSEGQRNIRLVHEAIKKGIKIIFAYWRWDINEELEPSTESMLQIPIDYLYKNRVEFFQCYLNNNNNKSLLIEFPHPMASDIIDIANCCNWITVYDVIDDWEEFSKKGQAIWYDKKIEERVVYSVDINIATAKKLKDKLCRVSRDDYFIISNGVDPNRMKRSKQFIEYDKRKGKVQIGYFGHLTDAWFDWDLVISLANKHNDWTFHLIGYGEPEKLNIPDNIILYGKKKPEELPKYAAYWDVAIIPFINCELTLSVNPIKIYEYLQLHLPTVASNMPELKQCPYTQIAIGVDEFEIAIIRALETVIDSAVVDKFIAENTWEKKLDGLLKVIDNFRIEDSYKFIYKREIDE